MNTRTILTTLALITTTLGAGAQGTAITYQGRLLDGGNPANGTYDLRCNLYDALSYGSLVAGPMTNAAVAVRDGLFVVSLDFGAGVFTGPARFLEIGVRSNGVAAAFNILAPRQELTPAPYAITSENLAGLLSAGQLTGVLPAGLLSGIYPNAITLNNAGNSFTGDGAGLTGLNATALSSGTVPDARLSANVALLNRNQTFFGTNVFGNGGGSGRLVVNNSFTGYLDTNRFTGISLQYDGMWGEGALMSSFDNGFAYLSFYTKAGGAYPLAKQMMIDRFGVVAVDQGNHNDGFLNNGATNGAGLTFGVGSGEGIASKRTAGGNQYGLDFYTGFTPKMSIAWNGSVGIGTTNPTDCLLDIEGDTHINDHSIFLRAGADRNHGIAYRETAAGMFFDGPFVWGYNGGALGTVGPDEISLKWDYVGNVWISNDCSVATLTIRGGADLAEPFQMSEASKDVPQGAVVVIDEDNPGRLKVSEQPYDTRVAGVVSGANGVSPGIQMQQHGLLEGGKNVALTGRVYVQADAGFGAIRPGDLLTTSATMGHAMKVRDHARAPGAILGKAMTGLTEGRGMVLVLVSLQ